jgi:hypothetical protein
MIEYFVFELTFDTFFLKKPPILIEAPRTQKGVCYAFTRIGVIEMRRT